MTVYTNTKRSLMKMGFKVVRQDENEKNHPHPPYQVETVLWHDATKTKIRLIKAGSDWAYYTATRNNKPITWNGLVTYKITSITEGTTKTISDKEGIKTDNVRIDINNEEAAADLFDYRIRKYAITQRVSNIKDALNKYIDVAGYPYVGQ